MIRIYPDYETGERAGAGGFQVEDIVFEDQYGNKENWTDRVDQGTHYYSARAVIRDLGLDPDKADYELAD